jgi:uncharacterized protein YqjF (DUF2071 family)
MNYARIPVRFSQEDLVAPKPTPLAVKTTLVDFAITTFAIDPAALAKYLPSGFEPDISTLSDGNSVAFISAVTFNDLDFRLCACPWPTFSFGQTNYRAYVLYRGKRVAWFFGTSLATPFVIVPRYVWLLPWHFATMRFNTTWNGDTCSNYELTTSGAWGAVDLALQGTDEPSGCLDGFLDEEDMSVILTHPLEGYYERRDGVIGTYSIWHDRLAMHRGIAKRAYFEVFHKLGLVDHTTKPHSVLLQKRTKFTILLPPRVLSP